MDKTLHRLYLRFRSPKIFLIALCTFIGTMLLMHFFFGVDSDWGGTNLTLSCEASVASAVITVAAEETLRLLRQILDLVKLIYEIVTMVKELGIDIRKILNGVLLIAEAQRDMLLDHRALLQALKEGDERILKTLTEGERDGCDHT